MKKLIVFYNEKLEKILFSTSNVFSKYFFHFFKGKLKNIYIKKRVYTILEKIFYIIIIIF